MKSIIYVPTGFWDILHLISIIIYINYYHVFVYSVFKLFKNKIEIVLNI